MKANTFNKRIFTPRQFLSDYAFIFGNLLSIVRANRNPDIGTAFRERILNVVSSVNGCRYCQWFHARLALSNGIDEKELKNLVDMQFHTNTPENQAPALMFAQHFAQTQGHYDTAQLAELMKHYGHKTGSDIFLLIRMITVGNLTGNTFDAFLSRLRGRAAEGSNALFEFMFFILAAPFLVFVLPFVRSSEN